MSFEFMRDWLARKLSVANDTAIAAGGTSLEELRRDAEARTVTPEVLAEVPSEIGKVVRYVREQQGWTRRDIADLADIDEDDVTGIETLNEPHLSPRSVVQLAGVCRFSVERFQRLANHVAVHEYHAPIGKDLRFAARSANVSTLSTEDFDAIRALVQVLSSRTMEQK